MPCSAKHTGWQAEDAVESFVGDHTDVRLLQNFWFNHSLLDTARIKPVLQPLASQLQLNLEVLREADLLFRLIDTDRSRTLQADECQKYLDSVGYLEDEIQEFFAKCDENCDGSIAWSEFLLGASALYKPTPTAKRGTVVANSSQNASSRHVPCTLHFTLEGASSALLNVEIDSGMPWPEVHAQVLRAIDTSETSSTSPKNQPAHTAGQGGGGGVVFFEYTNVKLARELVREAADIFDQIDVDRSGALERSELMERMRLPREKGGWGRAAWQVHANCTSMLLTKPLCC
jgi:Ca2+-binding EF-hand superfamily protein